MTVMIGATRVTLGAAWWARGTNLAERTGAAPAGAVDKPGGVDDANPADKGSASADDRQRRRLERWRTAHGFDAEAFRRRLADARITEADLLAMLAEAPDRIAGRMPEPRWAAAVEAVLADLASGADGATTKDIITGPQGFAVVVAPFVWRALARVRAAGIVDHVDSAALEAELGDRLAGTLVQLAARTLVLELNVLRVTNRLDGETPQERFASFARHYSRPEYPVLARLLAQACEQAVEGHLELLRRYRQDRAALVASMFSGIDPGPLASIAISGDGHRGRAVAVLRFSPGGRVVYKPRSLAVHAHVNEVLGWLNKRFPGLDLRRLQVLERDGYGWLEYAHYKPCRDRPRSAGTTGGKVPCSRCTRTRAPRRPRRRPRAAVAVRRGRGTRARARHSHVRPTAGRVDAPGRAPRRAGPRPHPGLPLGGVGG